MIGDASCKIFLCLVTHANALLLFRMAGQMGRNQQLAAKFQELRAIPSPYLAAACFAWGVAQAEALPTHQQGMHLQNSAAR